MVDYVHHLCLYCAIWNHFQNIYEKVLTMTHNNTIQWDFNNIFGALTTLAPSTGVVEYTDCIPAEK